MDCGTTLVRFTRNQPRQVLWGKILQTRAALEEHRTAEHTCERRTFTGGSVAPADQHLVELRQRRGHALVAEEFAGQDETLVATKPVEVVEASQQIRKGDGAVPDAAAAGAGVVGNEGVIGRAEHAYPGA